MEVLKLAITIKDLIKKINSNFSEISEKEISIDTDITALKESIQLEATTRAENDTLLQNDINTLRDDLNAEVNTRDTSDKELDTKIDTVSKDLTNVIEEHYTDLDEALKAEIENRENADNTLQTTLTAEIEKKQDIITDLTTIRSNAESGKSASDTIATYGDIVTHNANEFQLAGDYATNTDLTNSITAHNNSSQAHSYIQGLITTETSNRENADNNLQSQIDGLSAKSDVVDVVATYADLQAYDTETLSDNDIIKVLNDETHDNANTYYQWHINTSSFTFKGSDGSYYTKAEADTVFVPKTRTINGKSLDNNINLDFTDVGALSDTTKIPSKTSDLTNDSDFITSSYHDNTKQDIITDLTTIRSNAESGKSASDTIATYGDIVTHNANEFATPTDIKNGKLTILANGENIAIFTANQDSDVTANITIPDSATWGNITGVLSNQSDLQNALDVKQNVLTAGSNITITNNVISSAGGSKITVTRYT